MDIKTNREKQIEEAIVSLTAKGDRLHHLKQDVLELQVEIRRDEKRLERLKEHQAEETAPYLKDTPDLKTEKIGKIRI